MDQDIINRLRQPHPAQKSIDARAAKLLRQSSHGQRQSSLDGPTAPGWLTPAPPATKRRGKAALLS